MHEMLTDKDLDAVTGAVSSEWCFSLGKIEGRIYWFALPRTGLRLLRLRLRRRAEWSGGLAGVVGQSDPRSRPRTILPASRARKWCASRRCLSVFCFPEPLRALVAGPVDSRIHFWNGAFYHRNTRGI